MSKIDIRLTGTSAQIDSEYTRNITVEILNVEKSDILDYFTVEEILEHFEKSKILDEIGEDECKEYFDLTENTDND